MNLLRLAPLCSLTMDWPSDRKSSLSLRRISSCCTKHAAHGCETRWQIREPLCVSAVNTIAVKFSNEAHPVGLSAESTNAQFGSDVRHNKQYEDHSKRHRRPRFVISRARYQCVPGEGPPGEGRGEDRRRHRRDEGRGKRQDEVTRRPSLAPSISLKCHRSHTRLPLKAPSRQTVPAPGD